MGLRFTAVDTRFDSIDSGLKLQAGLIQSVARAITRLSEYAESSQTRYVEILTRLTALNGA